jgi:hypothetical protein
MLLWAEGAIVMSKDIVFLPHPNTFMKALHVSKERLDGKTRIAVAPALMKFLLEQLIGKLSFDQAYYLEQNPDVADSYRAGNILDLHEHFKTTGYFEGRLGAHPEVDEAFYLQSYPDVAEAIRAGRIRSAAEHYVITGASEDRIPLPQHAELVRRWVELAGEQDTKS